MAWGARNLGFHTVADRVQIIDDLRQVVAVLRVDKELVVGRAHEQEFCGRLFAARADQLGELRFVRRQRAFDEAYQFLAFRGHTRLVRDCCLKIRDDAVALDAQRQFLPLERGVEFEGVRRRGWRCCEDFGHGALTSWAQNLALYKWLRLKQRDGRGNTGCVQSIALIF